QLRTGPTEIVVAPAFRSRPSVNLAAGMKNFFRILRFGAPYRTYAVLNALLNLLATIFHLASLLLFIPFLRLLLGQVRPVHDRPVEVWTRDGLEGTFNWMLTRLIENNGQMGALPLISTAVVALFLFKDLFRYLAFPQPHRARRAPKDLPQVVGIAAAFPPGRTQRRSARIDHQRYARDRILGDVVHRNGVPRADRDPALPLHHGHPFARAYGYIA